MGQRLGRVAWNVEHIARWWTSATDEERFNMLQLSIQGEAKAPSLGEVRLAILLAESEAGEVSER